jgi:hypothetical protein
MNQSDLGQVFVIAPQNHRIQRVLSTWQPKKLTVNLMAMPNRTHIELFGDFTTSDAESLPQAVL